jgi:hypothetical protein
LRSLLDAAVLNPVHSPTFDVLASVGVFCWFPRAGRTLTIVTTTRQALGTSGDAAPATATENFRQSLPPATTGRKREEATFFFLAGRRASVKTDERVSPAVGLASDWIT